MGKKIYIPFDNHKTNSFNPFVSNLIQIGDFNVTSNLDGAKLNISPSLYQNVLSYTLDDLSLSVSETSTVISPSITINTSKKNINNFIRYSSFEKNLLLAFDYIFLNIPASLSIANSINGKIGDNVINATYNPLEKTTTFYINTNFIANPLQLNFLKYDLKSDENFAVHRVLKNTYEKYEVILNGIKYNIVDFLGAENFKNSYIKIVASGELFSNGNHSTSFFIVPKSEIFDDFFTNAPTLVEFLLQNPNTKGYNIDIEDEIITPQGYKLFYTQTFIFPKIDEYNLDLISEKFETFKTDIIDFARKKDENVTNVLLRKYIDSNLLSPFFDNIDSLNNQGDKMEILLSVYAYSFDERYKFINNLKQIRYITYSKENDISDDLIDTYLESFNIFIPKNVSIAKKRELLLNLNWLLKTKGTTQTIDYLLSFMNIPKEIVNYNEYINVISDKIDVDALKYYLQKIYGTNSLDNIAVDDNGYPKPLSNYIFEDDDYWHQFIILDEKLNNKYFTQSGYVNTTENIYEETFDLSGSTFEYVVPTGSCFTVSGTTIVNPIQENIYDDCNCEIINTDIVSKIIFDPTDLYTGCTKPVLDVWQECINQQVKLNIKGYGGKPPYNYVGVTDGQILDVGSSFTTKIIDSVGCESITVSGTTYCYSFDCVKNPIKTILNYICNVDENDDPIGTSTVVLTYSGGTAPYTINGNKNGDVLLNGQTIITEIIDSKGCTTGIISKMIECETLSTCTPIELELSAECVLNIRPEYVQVNLTYDLLNIPNTTLLENVVITVTEVSGANLIGGISNTQLFSLSNGVMVLLFRFDPIVSTCTFNVDIVVTLENGCYYTDNTDLSVNCTTINQATTYNKTLTT